MNNDLTIILVGILLGLLIILFIKLYPGSTEENWYPTTTYVNTPRRIGIYPTTPQNWWGGNYYNRLNWRPWGYHRPGYYYRRGPLYRNVGSPYSKPFTPLLADAGSAPGAPIPYGNPVPLDALRWRGMFGPMLTSIKSPKDYALGQWVRAGTAYTDNPNDFTYVDVYQLNLDPGRDLFSYAVVTKDGQRIPINLQRRHDRLEDGDRFKVQGMEGKGDFVFVEADKYTYVYT